jgi:hypothetical protein
LRHDELHLPHDRAGYTRRACPRCRAGFKTRATRRDASVLAFAIARRVEAADAGAALHPPERHCPYCGATEEPEAFWTAEQVAWVDALARGVAEEIRWHALRAPLARLAENPRPTYVAVAPRRPPRPPREAVAALRTLPLPCCGEEEQVSHGWIGPLRCHYCGYVHALDLARDIGLELALLRSWSER